MKPAIWFIHHVREVAGEALLPQAKCSCISCKIVVDAANLNIT